jgi:hypothetical protein
MAGSVHGGDRIRAVNVTARAAEENRLGLRSRVPMALIGPHPGHEGTGPEPSHEATKAFERSNQALQPRDEHLRSQSPRVRDGWHALSEGPRFASSTRRPLCVCCTRSVRQENRHTYRPRLAYLAVGVGDARPRTHRRRGARIAAIVNGCESGGQHGQRCSAPRPCRETMDGARPHVDRRRGRRSTLPNVRNGEGHVEPRGAHQPSARWSPRSPPQAPTHRDPDIFGRGQNYFRLFFAGSASSLLMG